MIEIREPASRDVLGPLRPGEEDLVYVDGLTGLCNQRLLAELLEEKFGELVSLAGSFALVMIDLDLFKEVNDRYGHLSGDDVLRETGELLRSTFRESDLIFRYGGDEFLVLLPGASAAEAEALGRRAREAMQRHEFFSSEEKKRIDVPLSFSIGVAAYPGDGESGREVLAGADARLYSEKRIHLATRRRKRVFRTGAVVTFAILVLSASLVVFLERQESPPVRPLVLIEPPPLQTDSAAEDERQALLEEIAELQRQIETLRATRPETAPSEHGGPVLVDLERKVAELTKLLEQQDEVGATEPSEPQVERVVPPPATDRPARPAAVGSGGTAATEPRVEATRTVVVPPRLENRVTPAYPPFAKGRGIEATVNIEVLVDESGRVVEARALGEPVGFGFEDAARRAAMASTWSPATRNGVPIAMKTTLQVRFEITR